MNSIQEYIIAFCTCPDINSAEKIARKLVEKQIAACVNIITELKSIYQWKGEICNEDEVLMIIKTISDNYQELEKEIKNNHPYDIPEIISYSIYKGEKSYLKWISESTVTFK